ncbi:hypothetical protein AK51_28890 [Serratia nematodiphila DZ0503SBS1]|nr:hypothetical protein AK51_28890 [Serratia nematodiphila DZ0503SBS1]
MPFTDRRLAAGQQRVWMLVILGVVRPAGHKGLDVAGVIGVKLLLNHILRACRFIVHHILLPKLTAAYVEPITLTAQCCSLMTRRDLNKTQK